MRQVPDTAEGLSLSAEEREVLLAGMGALVQELGEEVREALEGLRKRVEAGFVPREELGALEGVVFHLLETGAVRRTHRGRGEAVLASVYARTPGGAALESEVGKVNRALGALGGRRLVSLSIRARGPGRFSLSLELEGVGLTLELGREGPRVESLSVG